MAKKKTSRGKKGTKIRLIQSPDRSPKVTAKAGTKIQFVEITTDGKHPAKVGARLCGYGSGSCLALVETE